MRAHAAARVGSAAFAAILVSSALAEAQWREDFRVAADIRLAAAEHVVYGGSEAITRPNLRLEGESPSLAGFSLVGYVELHPAATFMGATDHGRIRLGISPRFRFNLPRSYAVYGDAVWSDGTRVYSFASDWRWNIGIEGPVSDRYSIRTGIDYNRGIPHHARPGLRRSWGSFAGLVWRPGAW